MIRHCAGGNFSKDLRAAVNVFFAQAAIHIFHNRLVPGIDVGCGGRADSLLDSELAEIGVTCGAAIQLLDG